MTKYRTPSYTKRTGDYSALWINLNRVEEMVQRDDKITLQYYSGQECMIAFDNAEEARRYFESFREMME